MVTPPSDLCSASSPSPHRLASTTGCSGSRRPQGGRGMRAFPPAPYPCGGQGPAARRPSRSLAVVPRLPRSPVVDHAARSRACGPPPLPTLLSPPLPSLGRGPPSCPLFLSVLRQLAVGSPQVPPPAAPRSCGPTRDRAALLRRHSAARLLSRHAPSGSTGLFSLPAAPLARSSPGCARLYPGPAGCITHSTYSRRASPGLSRPGPPHSEGWWAGSTSPRLPPQATGRSTSRGQARQGPGPTVPGRPAPGVGSPLPCTTAPHCLAAWPGGAVRDTQRPAVLSLRFSLTRARLAYGYLCGPPAACPPAPLCEPHSTAAAGGSCGPPSPPGAPRGRAAHRVPPLGQKSSAQAGCCRMM